MLSRDESDNGEWSLRVLFSERSDISVTADFATEHGFSLELERLYGIDDVHRVRFGLTENQHRTLVDGAVCSGGTNNGFRQKSR